MRAKAPWHSLAHVSKAPLTQPCIRQRIWDSIQNHTQSDHSACPAHPKKQKQMSWVLQEDKSADPEQLRVYARDHDHTVAVYSARVVVTPHAWTLEPLRRTDQATTMVIPLAAITDVFVGKQRDVFLDAAVKPVLEECCFSVVFVCTQDTPWAASTAAQRRELHLVANSAAQRAYFLRQLQCINCGRQNATKRQRSPDRNGLSPLLGKSSFRGPAVRDVDIKPSADKAERAALLSFLVYGRFSVGSTNGVAEPFLCREAGRLEPTAACDTSVVCSTMQQLLPDWRSAETHVQPTVQCSGSEAAGWGFLRLLNMGPLSAWF